MKFNVGDVVYYKDPHVLGKKVYCRIKKITAERYDDGKGTREILGKLD